MRCIKRNRGCICCKKSYNGREPVAVIDPVDDEGGDGNFTDKGFYELLSQFQHHSMLMNPATTSKRLEAPVARQVAKYAKTRAREVAKWQNPIERQVQKQLMAPFELDEIKLGKLLGVGGFSYVFEIKAFDTETSNPSAARSISASATVSSSSSSTSAAASTAASRRRSSSSTLSLGSASIKDEKEQRKAREFLAQHATRPHEEKSPSPPSDHETQHVAPAAEQQQEPQEQDLSRYAIKHLRPTLLQTPEVFAKAAMDLACEAQMMLCLNHPNIVKLRGWRAGGASAYKEGTHNSYFLIIDRLLETLEDRIFSWRQQWKKARSFTVQGSILNRLQGRKNLEAKAATDALLVKRTKVAYDMSCGLAYLHEKRVVYRDLKSSNVGFDIRGDVKLFDFGLSRYLPASTTGDVEETFRMSNVGTRRYTAPEVTAKKPYNLKADVYSFGVALWEILMMSTPTKVAKPAKGQVIPPKRKPLLPCPCWPQELQNLVSSMLEDEPTNRPTMVHARTILKEVLVRLSDPELYTEFFLVDDGISRRRRSTFRLECSDSLKDLDDDSLNQQSDTSVSLSSSGGRM